MESAPSAAWIFFRICKRQDLWNIIGRLSWAVTFMYKLQSNLLVAWCVLPLFGIPLSTQAQTRNVALLSFTNAWRYNQTVSWDNIDWTAKTFDDTALPSGRGVLAYETNNAFVTT